jgi:transaldolase
LAARRLGQDGIPVNFTLGFSARQNYVAALVAQPRFVNVFMGRLNAFVADNELGDGQNVGEKATLATQRELLALREAGRTRSRLIGASMREGGQVATLAGLDVFTMPPKIASQYARAPVAGLSSQVENDPSVRFGEGVALNAFNWGTLWEVPVAFKDSVECLLAGDIDGATPEDVQGHFSQAGYADLFPRWTEEDIRTATADGKIPVFAHWREQLAAGQTGLDALMNLSAFQSLATDQRALDDRIRSLI